LGYFLLYQPTALLSDPLALFKVWDGGMASHGGFVGVGLALAWFSRSEKIPFFHLADLIASTAAGLMFGRIANFINGELGQNQRRAVGLATPHSAAAGNPVFQILPRHPSQLYQASERALLLAIMQWRFGKETSRRTNPGHLAGEFWLIYAGLRMVGEAFREPDASLLFGMSRESSIPSSSCLVVWRLSGCRAQRPGPREVQKEAAFEAARRRQTIVPGRTARHPRRRPKLRRE